MIPTDKLIKFYEEVTESINYYDDSAFKDPKGEEEDDEEGEEEDDEEGEEEDSKYFHRVYNALVSNVEFVYGGRYAKTMFNYTSESIQMDNDAIAQRRENINDMMLFYDFIDVLQLVADYYHKYKNTDQPPETIKHIGRVVTLGPSMQCLAACRAGNSVDRTSQIATNYYGRGKPIQLLVVEPDDDDDDHYHKGQ